MKGHFRKLLGFLASMNSTRPRSRGSPSIACSKDAIHKGCRLRNCGEVGVNKQTHFVNNTMLRRQKSQPRDKGDRLGGAFWPQMQLRPCLQKFVCNLWPNKGGEQPQQVSGNERLWERDLESFAEKEYFQWNKRSRWLPYNDTVFNGALNPMVLPKFTITRQFRVVHVTVDGLLSTT